MQWHTDNIGSRSPRSDFGPEGESARVFSKRWIVLSDGLCDHNGRNSHPPSVQFSCLVDWPASALGPDTATAKFWRIGDRFGKHHLRRGTISPSFLKRPYVFAL